MALQNVSDSARTPADVRAVMEIARTCALRRVSRALSPAGDGPVVVCVVRDEASVLPAFLRHYRAIGVSRFLIIDNGSRDGSPAFLAAQPDVDGFTTYAPFHWRAKQGWIMRALAETPAARWIISADADEHLVFDGVEQRPVCDLTRWLDQRGWRRARGMMIDMYGDGPVMLAAEGDGAALAACYGYFDPDGYWESKTAEIVSRVGGPRLRAFGALDGAFKPQLTKHPLFRLAPGEVLVNPHHIWPCEANFTAPCVVGLLHYKFHAASVRRIGEAVAARRYWNDSLEYRCYAEGLAARPDLTLMHEGSRRYTGAGDLIDAGLIDPIEWDAKPAIGARFEAAKRAARAEGLSRKFAMAGEAA